MEYKNYAMQKIEHIEIIKKVLNSILKLLKLKIVLNTPLGT
jgi:hypothetical protein